MKKFAALFVVLLATSVAAAQSKPAAKPAGKTHAVTTEFVSADVAAKTITLKDETGANKTGPMEGKALAQAAKLKLGEKVTAMCRDNDKGEHQAVVSVRPAAAPAKSKS